MLLKNLLEGTVTDISKAREKRAKKVQTRDKKPTGTFKDPDELAAKRREDPSKHASEFRRLSKLFKKS